VNQPFETDAHRQPPQRRPWYRRCVAPGLFVLAVLIVIAGWHLEGRAGASWSQGRTEIELRYFGWPVDCVQLLLATKHKVDGTTRMAHRLRWFPEAVLVNSVASAIVFLCVLAATAAWMRRHGRWQFGLRTLLLLVLTVSVLLTMNLTEFALWTWWTDRFEPPWAFPLYVGTVNRSVPMMVTVHAAVACCCYVLGLAGFVGVEKLLSGLRRARR